MTQHFVPRMGKNFKTADMSMVHTRTGNVSGTSFTITPLTTPALGDILFVHVGNTVTTDPTAITVPSGWVSMTSTSGSPGMGLWYKIATASEPATYTFTLPSSNWGWEYFNMRGVYVGPGANYTLCPKLDIVGAPGTYTSPTFVISTPGIAISLLSKTTTTAWDPSVGWTLVTGSGQAKSGYKIFSDIDTSESITWALTAGGTTSTGLTHSCILFLANRINH